MLSFPAPGIVLGTYRLALAVEKTSGLIVIVTVAADLLEHTVCPRSCGQSILRSKPFNSESPHRLLLPSARSGVTGAPLLSLAGVPQGY